MKTRTFILFLLLNNVFSFCQNPDKGIWKSMFSNLQIKFDDNWELIAPNLDTENKIIVGLTDQNDHSSIVVKITQDIPKEQLSDLEYKTAIEEQMLSANAENRLVADDQIDFKGKKYTRQVFIMKTKFGVLIQTIYTHRNGKKMTGIQFSYPKNLIEKPAVEMPSKIEKVLNEMTI